MRRTIAVVAVTVSLVGGGASSAAGDQVSVPGGNGSRATITLPDYVLIGPDCQQLPFTVDFALAPGQDVASVELSGGVSGSNETIGGFLATFNGSAVLPGTVQLCPGSAPVGRYVMNARFNSGIEYPDSNSTVAFNVSAAQATATVSARARGRAVVVSGKVTASGANGSVGVAGTYELATLTPRSKGGSGKWVSQGSASPDSFGVFREILTYKVPGKGGKVRLSVTCEANYCTPVTVVVPVR